ncbi:MAG TPA: hypothetical protein VFL12_10840 [Thermoanaerobaculia bacterium]|nr:hypothetical protein [Thermoanaerobaculia bacterium]
MTGKTDERRAPGRSRTFGSIAVAAILLFVLLGVWVLRAGPADLRGVEWVVPSPRGEWIALSGPARWHRPVFLENVRTRAFVRAAFSRGTVPVISPDGSTAAWTAIEPGFPDSTFTPRTVSLADPRHPGTSWETRGLHENPLLLFSPDARRLAIIASDRVAVWDAGSGRMLAAAKPAAPLWKESRGFTGATFVGDDLLRIFAARPAAGGGTSIEFLELDVAAKRFRSTGSAGPFRRTFPIIASPDRSRLLVREARAAVHLLDGETGRTIVVFSGAASFRSACFLSDGRIVLFESENGAGRLRTLSADGAELSSFPVAGEERAWFVGETRPGQLMLAAFSGRGDAGTRRVIVADLVRGSVERWADDLLPASPYAANLAGDFGAAPAPGSLATRLFFTRDRALVELEGPGRIRRLLPNP